MSDEIVVGVSPSSGSPRALRWAADEVRLRGGRLVAVMAWRPPRPPAAPGGRPPAGLPTTREESAADAERTLREFVDAALGPGSDAVECTVVKGSALNALRTAAFNAQLLVVGEARPRGIDAVRSTLVAPQLVRTARCPVVVMPAITAT